MRNDKLFELLRSSKAPEPDEASKDRALVKSRLAFINRSLIPEREQSRRFYLRALVGVTIAACVILLAPRHLQTHQSVAKIESEELASGRTVLAETERLFPEGVTAVVAKNGVTSLVPASQSAGGDRLPIQIELVRGKDRIRILTFSGESIEVTIGGTTYRLEPLATGNGEVIVLGPGFAWRQGQNALPDGTHIDAVEM